MEQVLNYQQHFNLMKFIKNFILILLFILPISNSFGAMVTTIKQNISDDQVVFYMVLSLIMMEQKCSQLWS